MAKPHVCIVGGGVIGIACAFYLMKTERFRITLIDEHALGQETSRGNCGLIHHHSHLLPLAHPGMLKKACKMMLSQGRKSPFYIKPSLSWSLWRWLWQFYRNCNTTACEHNMRVRSVLIENSWQLYRKLFASGEIPYQWQARGSLKVFQHQAALTQEQSLLKPHYDRYGVNCAWLSGNELVELEPTLQDKLAGGCYFADDAHLQPDLFLKAWVDSLKQITIREQCRAEMFKETHGKAKTLITNQGEIAADYFVFATGAFTPLLKQQLQCDLSIQPGKGYSMSLAYGRERATRPVAFVEQMVVYTPMDDYYRLGSVLEFVGYNKKLTEARFELLQSTAQIYFKNLQDNLVLEKWCGLRSMTPDGVPYIGQCPQFENVTVAAGHNMEGMTMAPATGQLITAFITRETPPFDPTPYRLNRKNAAS